MLAKDVPPLDIDVPLQLAIAGKLKNRVTLIGVELEGGWAELPPGIKQLEPDTSVFHNKRPPGTPHIGELGLGPAMPAGMPELLRTHYPKSVNDTCGMHVHMSFVNPRYYGVLMVPEYQTTVLKYLTDWAKGLKNKQGNPVFKDDHCIWMRLRGESRYCRIEFWPDVQANTKEKGHDQTTYGHRYTVIHYCGRLKSIECRVLPMMRTSATAAKAVRRLVDITNACLYVLGKDGKKDKFDANIELPEGLKYEETVVERL